MDSTSPTNSAPINVRELRDVLQLLRDYKVTKATIGPYILELALDTPEPDEKTFNEQLTRAAEEAEMRAGLVDPSQVKFK